MDSCPGRNRTLPSAPTSLQKRVVKVQGPIFEGDIESVVIPSRLWRGAEQLCSCRSAGLADFQAEVVEQLA